MYTSECRRSRAPLCCTRWSQSIGNHHATRVRELTGCQQVHPAKATAWATGQARLSRLHCRNQSKRQSLTRPLSLHRHPNAHASLSAFPSDLRHPGETCSSHRHALLSVCKPAARLPLFDKPSSGSPPLHRPWSRSERGRNSTPTSRTNVTSRGNYMLACLLASNAVSADRPCEHLNSCDIIIIIAHHHHRHHPPRARTLCGLYLSTLTMRFLHPRSSIPHLCVLRTDSQRDQLTKYPGLLYHNIPASANPLILFISIKSPPHNQTVHQAADLSTHPHYSIPLSVVAVVSSSAQNQQITPEISRNALPGPPPPPPPQLRFSLSVCLSGLWRAKTAAGLHVKYHQISPKHAPHRPR
jgi:hypothetical protein